MPVTSEPISRGRPTTFREEYISELYEYANGGWVEFNDVMPTLERFCHQRGLHAAQMRQWAAKNDELATSLNTLKQAQLISLANGALRGELNASISKLFLSANHGVNEKSEQHHTSDGTIAPTQIILRGVEPDDIISH